MLLLRFFVLCLIACLSFSCSKTKVAFEWADNFIVWQADDFFDINGEQKKLVKGEARQALETLRAQQFHKYAKVLENGHQNFATAASADEIHSTLEKVRADILPLMDEALVSFAPHAVNVVDGITPDNWSYFHSHFLKKIAKDRDKGFDSDQYLDRIDKWISISRAQRAELRDWLNANPYPTELSLKNREHLLATFEQISEIKLVDGKVDPESFTISKIKNTVLNWPSTYKSAMLPEFANAREQHRQLWYKKLATLTWGESQRQGFLKKISELAQDLVSLAKKT